MNPSGRRQKDQEPAVHSVLWTLTLGFLFLGGLTLACVFLGGRQYVLLQYYDQINAMDAEVYDLRQEVELIRIHLQGTKEDPFFVEKLAREQMNYSAPGELIFRFD